MQNLQSFLKAVGADNPAIRVETETNRKTVLIGVNAPGFGAISVIFGQDDKVDCVSMPASNWGRSGSLKVRPE